MEKSRRFIGKSPELKARVNRRRCKRVAEKSNIAAIKVTGPSFSKENSSVNLPEIDVCEKSANKLNGCSQKGDTSKSLFKKIEKRLCETSRNINDNFCKNLVDAVKNRHYNAPDCLNNYYSNRVIEAILKVNASLDCNCKSSVEGAMASNKQNPLKRPNPDYSNKENNKFDFSLWPKSKWVFQTPPNRKLNLTNKEQDPSTKPVVMQTTKKGLVFYKMNEKINVNLSNFNHKQEVQIDGRFMVEEARISVKNNEADDTMDYNQTTETDSGEEKEPEELEQHFLSLTCRPKKIKLKLSRSSTAVKIKPNRLLTLGDKENNLSTNSTNCEDWQMTETDDNNRADIAMEQSFNFEFVETSEQITGKMFDDNGHEKGAFNLLP